MVIRFEFRNGYTLKADKDIFKMFCRYYTTQLTADTFIVDGLREYNGQPNYETRKLILRATAQEWQHAFSRITYYYSELFEWYSFFEKYAKRYGLVEEFRENGII